jgi:hypothetical protein
MTTAYAGYRLSIALHRRLLRAREAQIGLTQSLKPEKRLQGDSYPSPPHVPFGCAPCRTSTTRRAESRDGPRSEHDDMGERRRCWAVGILETSA